MAVGDDSLERAERDYAAMRRIRRFEETVLEQHGLGNVPGPLHLSIGQEAVAVGTCSQLRETDVILSTHRGHHHILAKGARSDRLMAELLGRSDGYSRGRGGSMHVAIPSLGIIGTNGIVGGGLPIGAGLAYGMQVLKRDDVAVCFFGEGAAATGNFGEAINIASLWKLPLIFICENNQFVEMTPQSLHVAGEVWRRAEGYGFPGVKVDGNDVSAVAAAVAAAAERARGGDGPTLIEALTYRWYGHYVGDPALFRDQVEVDEWRQERDPLKRTADRLSKQSVEELDRRVESEIDEALNFALNSPVAGVDCLALDHYEAS
jgi:hypothetical protein